MSNKAKCDCHTECKVPGKCIPPTVGRKKPSAPTVTIQGLLDLIEEKCDKETCKILQAEIELLYILLGLEDERIDGLPKPGTKPKPKPELAFQLIKNMVDSLKGDLKGKYPSAELLKQQIQALWKCMYNKQEHHGDWKDNFTLRTVTPETDDLCALDGEVDTAPKTIKVITPVDVGSTVFNTIDGRRCLFESLVDNNTVEPTKLSVLQGKWINYCDIKDAIDCVLPRHIATDCHEACDDPNKDGVIEEKTLCQQLAEINARLKKLEKFVHLKHPK